jgi:hypothetical protein
VRYLCANHHPDHDTIARFRRENEPLVKSVFVHVLELAREVKLLRLGMISVDGTKIAARAGKSGCRTRAQIAAETARLEGEVESLLARAESADGRPPDDGQNLPKELADRKRRLEQLREARRRLDARHPPDDDEPKPGGKKKKEGSAAAETVHPVEPDSRLLPTAQGPFIQGYNAQAAVSAEGVTLILGVNVVAETNDRRQLRPTVEAIPAPLAEATTVVLADAGYDSCEPIQQLEARGMKVYCPPQKVGAQKPRGLERRRIWEQGRRRREELDQPGIKKLYGHRAKTSEPTFHIIKRLMGFGRFLLRGLEKVNLEWNLVALAYNCRKIAAALG